MPNANPTIATRAKLRQSINSVAAPNPISTEMMAPMPPSPASSRTCRLGLAATIPSMVWRGLSQTDSHGDERGTRTSADVIGQPPSWDAKIHTPSRAIQYGLRADQELPIAMSLLVQVSRTSACARVRLGLADVREAPRHD